MRVQPRRVRRSSVVFTQNQSYDGHDGDEGPLPAHSLRQAPGHHAQGQSDARQEALRLRSLSRFCRCTANRANSQCRCARSTPLQNLDNRL